MGDLEAFRLATREWLEINCPASMRWSSSASANETLADELVWGGRKQQFASGDTKLWLERMAERGWTAPTWPKEYGGGGLDKDEAKVLAQEMRSLRIKPPLIGFGLTMIGPLILEHGSEDQKKRYLPEICRGEIRWCQGYSEPGAGSDLAGLQTRAVLDGDEFVVNGQKVWTSYADKADWMFCLVRTEPDRPRHRGISYLLIDMRTPGIEVRPLRLLTGEEHFNEVVFDEVRVPAENLVGERGEGWTVSRATLKYERGLMGGNRITRRAFDHLVALAGSLEVRGAPPAADPSLRDRIAALEARLRAGELHGDRLFTAALRGESPGLGHLVTKLYTSELGHNLARLKFFFVGEVVDQQFRFIVAMFGQPVAYGRTACLVCFLGPVLF